MISGFIDDDTLIHFKGSKLFPNAQPGGLENLIIKNDTKDSYREKFKFDLIAGENEILKTGLPPISKQHLRKKGLREVGYDPLFFSDQAELALGFPSDELARKLSRFYEGDIQIDFGTRYLSGFVKQEQEVTSSQLERYRLKLDMRENGKYRGRNFSSRFFDARYNFCLICDEALIASIGFDIKEGFIYISQIQGERGKAEELKPFRWEKTLLSYAIEWAQSMGIPEVRVMSVDNNRWAQVNNLKKEQGKMIYDVTARRIRHNGNKFRRDEKTRDYVMRLD